MFNLNGLIKGIFYSYKIKVTIEVIELRPVKVQLSNTFKTCAGEQYRAGRAT